MPKSGLPPEEASKALPGRANIMRRPYSQHRLAPDMAVRQGEITRLALDRLGRDGALAFLNQSNEALGGRPLAIATETASGFLKIKAAIESHVPIK